MTKKKFRNSYDEDIERHKRFPWRSSFRRPMTGPSSAILLILMAAIYLMAAVFILVADGRPISLKALRTPHTPGVVLKEIH